MNKLVVSTLALFMFFLISCSQNQETAQQQITQQQTEINNLKEDMSQLKLQENARSMVGSKAADCKFTETDAECDGDRYLRVGDRVECIYKCINKQCVATDCRVNLNR